MSSWVGNPGRPPYVIPCGSAGLKEKKYHIWFALLFNEGIEIDSSKCHQIEIFKLVTTVKVGLREANLHFQFWLTKSIKNGCLRSVIYLKLSDFFISDIIFCLFTGCKLKFLTFFSKIFFSPIAFLERGGVIFVVMEHVFVSAINSAVLRSTRTWSWYTKFTGCRTQVFH